MSILDFFRKAKAKVSAFFVKVFGQEASQKFADGAVALLKTAAGVIVVDVVKAIELANPMASPADKRNAAFQQIMADAKIQGLGLTSSVINLLIELAVQAILKQNIVPVQ